MERTNFRTSRDAGRWVFVIPVADIDADSKPGSVTVDPSVGGDRREVATELFDRPILPIVRLRVCDTEDGFVPFRVCTGGVVVVVLAEGGFRTCADSSVPSLPYSDGSVFCRRKLAPSLLRTVRLRVRKLNGSIVDAEAFSDVAYRPGGPDGPVSNDSNEKWWLS